MKINEDINKIISQQVQLTGKRKRLLEELQKFDMNVANIYESAINVLHSSNVPNNIHLSAHALREVIDKLPESTNMPKIKQASSLGNLVKNFGSEWSQFNERFNWSAENVWADHEQSIVKMILKKCHDFITSAKNILPTKESKFKNKLKTLLERSNLDSIPLRKEQELIEVLKQCNEYFIRVAHHGSTDLDLFIENLNQFEYVLSIKVPTTFKNRDEILKLIKEVEEDETK